MPPNRLIEENLWRAIRWGLGGELIDLRDPTRVRPARAAIEELVEWVQPVAEEIGAAPFLAVPDGELGRAAACTPRGGGVAARGLRRAGARRGARPVSEQPPDPSIEDVVQAIRAMRVADLLQSTTFTFAQLAFAKLDEPTRDLDEARLAIESLRALLPLAEQSLTEEVSRDLRSTVANLQLVYADLAGPPKAEPEPQPEDDG